MNADGRKSEPRVLGLGGSRQSPGHAAAVLGGSPLWMVDVVELRDMFDSCGREGRGAAFVM